MTVAACDHSSKAKHPCIFVAKKIEVECEEEDDDGHPQVVKRTEYECLAGCLECTSRKDTCIRRGKHHEARRGVANLPGNLHGELSEVGIVSSKLGFDLSYRC